MKKIVRTIDGKEITLHCLTPADMIAIQKRAYQEARIALAEVLRESGADKQIMLERMEGLYDNRYALKHTFDFISAHEGAWWIIGLACTAQGVDQTVFNDLDWNEVRRLAAELCNLLSDEPPPVAKEGSESEPDPTPSGATG